MLSCQWSGHLKWSVLSYSRALIYISHKGISKFHLNHCIIVSYIRECQAKRTSLSHNLFSIFRIIFKVWTALNHLLIMVVIMIMIITNVLPGWLVQTEGLVQGPVKVQFLLNILRGLSLVSACPQSSMQSCLNICMPSLKPIGEKTQSFHWFLLCSKPSLLRSFC